MAEVRFKFKLRLLYMHEYGAIFVDWLPLDQRDAIDLPIGDPDAKVEVWFETDPEYVWEGRVIDGTSLYGEMRVSNLSQQDLELIARRHDILDESSKASQRYRSILRRAVQLADHAIADVLHIITVNYGQYWIVSNDLIGWDSRHQHLLNYSYFDLNLLRSVDGGDTWLDFSPTIDEIRNYRPLQQPAGDNEIDVQSYISRDDWLAIPHRLESAKLSTHETEEYRLICLLYSSARREATGGFFRYAFIEATTALEMALDYHLRRMASASKTLFHSLQAVRELALPSKFSVVALHLPVTRSTVEMTLQAIAIRNSIVHEGKDVSDDATHLIEPMLLSIAAILPFGPYRFPKDPSYI